MLVDKTSQQHRGVTSHEHATLPSGRTHRGARVEPRNTEYNLIQLLLCVTANSLVSQYRKTRNPSQLLVNTHSIGNTKVALADLCTTHRHGHQPLDLKLLIMRAPSYHMQPDILRTVSGPRPTSL